MKISPQGYVKNDIRQSPANSREQAVTHHLLAAFCVQSNRKWRVLLEKTRFYSTIRQNF